MLSIIIQFYLDEKPRVPKYLSFKRKIFQNPERVWKNQSKRIFQNLQAFKHHARQKLTENKNLIMQSINLNFLEILVRFG